MNAVIYADQYFGLIQKNRVRIQIYECLVSSLKAHEGKPFKKRFMDYLEKEIDKLNLPLEYICHVGSDSFPRIQIKMGGDYYNESFSFGYQSKEVTSENIKEAEESLGHIVKYLDWLMSNQLNFEKNLLPSLLSAAEELQMSIKKFAAAKEGVIPDIYNQIVKDFSLPEKV